MFKFLASIVLLTVISVNIHAQSVSGKIEDAVTNSSISHATVQLSKTDSTTSPLLTVSDTKGNFIFNKVPDGSYILSITSIGYSTFKKEVTVIGENVG